MNLEPKIKFSGFNFDMGAGFPFGFIETWIPGNPSATKFSSTVVTWGNSTDNGVQYQIELIFNYNENDIAKNLIYTSTVLEETNIFEFEGMIPVIHESAFIHPNATNV